MLTVLSPKCHLILCQHQSGFYSDPSNDNRGYMQEDTESQIIFSIDVNMDDVCDSETEWTITNILTSEIVKRTGNGYEK